MPQLTCALVLKSLTSKHFFLSLRNLRHFFENHKREAFGPNLGKTSGRDFEPPFLVGRGRFSNIIFTPLLLIYCLHKVKNIILKIKMNRKGEFRQQGKNNIGKLQLVGNFTHLFPKIKKNCRKIRSRDSHYR